MLLSFLAVTVTYRSPVTRLEEWDEIAETLARSFGAPGTRPFYIDPGSELGRKVADLFRIKLERAQAVQTTFSEAASPGRAVHGPRCLPGAQRRHQDHRVGGPEPRAPAQAALCQARSLWSACVWAPDS